MFERFRRGERLPGHAGATEPTDSGTPADIPAAVAALDRRVPLMSVHLTGTLAMGERLDRCAVDSFGRLHGTDGVWVSDASMLPDAPGINPQGTLMAIARRNAHRLLEEGS